MRIKKKAKILILVFTLIAIIGSSIFGIAIKMKGNASTGQYDGLTASQEAVIERVMAAKYAADTKYTGGDVPYQLYDVPFRHSDELYIPNKDLPENISEEEVDEYIQTAEAFTKMMFASDYRSIARDTGKFIDEYESFFETEDMLELGEEEALTTRKFGSNIAEWYVDNEIECKYEFKSDRSLLYSDLGNYKLRCAITLTYFGEDGEEVKGLEELYGIKATYGQPVTLMVELDYIPTKPEYVYGFDIITYIEDE